MKNNQIQLNKIAVAFLLSISLISCGGGGSGSSSTQSPTNNSPVPPGGNPNESSGNNPDTKTEGNITYTLIQPNDITLTNNSIVVSLNSSSGESVSVESTVFGQPSSFNNILAGNYSLTTAYGLADAKFGNYYESLNQPVLVTAGETTNLGNINLNKLSSGIVPVTLSTTGLDSGDTVTVAVSDNGKYLFNTFTINSGNNTLKFISGDNLTLTFTVGSKYQSVVPVNFVASNNKSVNVTFTKAVSSNAVFVYSAYKDIGINMNWYDPAGINTNVMSTMVNESVLTPLAQALPKNANTATWAFATGECGSENWAGMSYSDFASVNVNSFVKANKNYIVSTGGAAGVFTCSTQNGMKTFVDRYMSPNLVGLDFDIEGSQTNAQISSLINNIAYIKQIYPNLRISFTLATLADSTGSHAGLNSTGDYVVRTAKNAKLDFYVNLMTMDYGNVASPSVCPIDDETGQCDMSKSVVQAVNNLKYTYGIANNRIEVTPLIGDADVPNEVFTIYDAQTTAVYVKDNGLAGYHYWSYDRDTPCVGANKNSKTTCNLAPNATSLGFNNAIAPYFQ